MKRLVTAVLPLAWTLVFLVPSVYVVWGLVEGFYEVPLLEGSFRFERPWAAILLVGAPMVLLARGWIQERSAPRLAISRVHDLAVGKRRGIRTYLRHVPTGARTVAVILFALGLMGPQSIHARDRSDVEGIDIMLTLDLSLSMQAMDMTTPGGQPQNRLMATQAVVDDFVARRPNDRIGAVVFGREAYTLMPLTTDKEALRSAIAELELGMIDGRGTAIGNAVGTSLNRLRDSDAASRVIILLTDGDSNSGNVSPQQAAEIARQMPHRLGSEGPNGQSRRGVKIYSVLMGASDEANVQQGTDIFGRPLLDRGNFPINPELLREMSEATGGEFFQATDRRSLERSFHTILDRLERSEIEDTGRTYGELFPAFVWPAFALVVFELLFAAFVVRRWP